MILLDREPIVSTAPEKTASLIQIVQKMEEEYPFSKIFYLEHCMCLLN